MEEELTPEEKQVLIDIRRVSLGRGITAGVVAYTGLKLASSRFPVLAKRRITIPCYIAACLVGSGSYGPTATQKMLSLENSQLAVRVRKRYLDQGWTDEQVNARFGVKSTSQDVGFGHPEKSEFTDSLNVSSPPDSAFSNNNRTLNLQDC